MKLGPCVEAGNDMIHEYKSPQPLSTALTWAWESCPRQIR